MGSSCSKNNYSRRESRKELVEEHIANLDDTLGQKDYENITDNIPPSLDKESAHHSSMNESYSSTDDKKSDLTLFQTNTLKRDSLLSKRVELPQEYDEYEWICEKALFYIEECQLIFESISDSCNPQTCPEMTAGPHYTYLWTDENHRNSISLPACNYISNSFIWINNKLNSQEFENVLEGVYPENYITVMQIIFKKLFRVYAHVYHHHLNEFIKQNAEVHLNTSFKYFGMFVREFHLISRKEEAPLRKLLEKLIQEDTPSD